MAITEFVYLGIDLCSLFLSAFIHISVSLVATGKLIYGFLSHGLNGITAALDFIPTCTNNGFACSLEAFRIFYSEVGKSFDIYESETRLRHILVGLTLFSIPFLREIVLTCLTFSITLILAILVKVFKASRNRARRRAFSRFRSAHLSVADLKNGFKKLKARFKPTPIQRPSHSTKQNNAVSTSTLHASLTCLICYEKPKSVVLLPCKHACLCVDCAKNLLERQMFCPLCRKRIISAMQIYI